MTEALTVGVRRAGGGVEMGDESAEWRGDSRDAAALDDERGRDTGLPEKGARRLARCSYERPGDAGDDIDGDDDPDDDLDDDEYDDDLDDDDDDDDEDDLETNGDDG